jgi:predicted TIM-barrel fold metal-dependent hydrolase
MMEHGALPGKRQGELPVTAAGALTDLVSADSHLEVSATTWCPDSAVDEAAALFDRATVTDRTSRSHLGGLVRRNPLRPAAEDEPAEDAYLRQRLEDMSLDGVSAEILYPSHVFDALASLPLPPQLAAHLAARYNDWVNGLCAGSGGRLGGLAVLPSTGLEEAIREVSRAASLPGIVGVTLHQWPNGTGRPAPCDEEFWDLASGLSVPLTFHIGIGAGMLGARLAPEPDLAYLLAPFSGHTEYTITQLITCGLFDRHPELRIAVGECGIGWVPYYAEQADLNHARYAWSIARQLPQPPSKYVRRNFLFGFQEDVAGLRMLAADWDDCLLWGSDYPHTVSNWPASRSLLSRETSGLPAQMTAKIVAGNARRFYRLTAPSPADVK